MNVPDDKFKVRLLYEEFPLVFNAQTFCSHIWPPDCKSVLQNLENDTEFFVHDGKM